MSKPEADPIQDLVTGPFGDLSLANPKPSQEQPTNPAKPEPAPEANPSQPVLQPQQPLDTNNNPPREVQENKIWCRLLIPSRVAGAIIGRGGQTIRSLREEYQAQINIPEARAPERVLKICVKSRETLDCLVLRIAEILKDEITRSGIRERRPREGETELKLLVQSSQAGAIIGTRGTAVRTLRESTGSRININPDCCPQSTERVAAIIGRPETVVNCIRMIYDILEKVPPKGSEQRYDPNNFDPSYDYGGWGYDPRPHPYPWAMPYHYPYGAHEGQRGPPFNIGPRQYQPHFPQQNQFNNNIPPGQSYTQNPRFPPPNSPPNRANAGPGQHSSMTSSQAVPPRGFATRATGGNQGASGNQSPGTAPAPINPLVRGPRASGPR